VTLPLREQKNSSAALQNVEHSRKGVRISRRIKNTYGTASRVIARASKRYYTGSAK
jgi:hypothetical protein